MRLKATVPKKIGLNRYEQRQAIPLFAFEAAYNRLMRMAHPDKGGTSGLAAQLNAARDRLLEG